MNRPAPTRHPINCTETGINFDSRTLGLTGQTQREFLADRKRVDIWVDVWSDADTFRGKDIRSVA
jgi:hypothetical protein